eukprot:SAG31_NODE_3317_length_4424_cov_3.662197_4_plen_243_part_00
MPEAAQLRRLGFLTRALASPPPPPGTDSPSRAIAVPSSAAAVAADIEARGAALGIKFYLFCWTDLFGTLRSKLVPHSAVASIAEDGAGFAGFAAWMDMSPADGDVLALPGAPRQDSPAVCSTDARPLPADPDFLLFVIIVYYLLTFVICYFLLPADPDSFIQLPWKKEVAWLACDPYKAGAAIAQAPRNVLKAQRTKLRETHGYTLKTGVELEFFLLARQTGRCLTLVASHLLGRHRCLCWP